MSNNNGSDTEFKPKKRVTFRIDEECLKSLIRGKTLHIHSGDLHITIFPPQDGLYMSRDEAVMLNNCTDMTRVRMGLNRKLDEEEIHELA